VQGTPVVGRLPWHVPVRLVHRDDAGPLGAVEQHRVALVDALPGVVGLDVTTVRAGDVELLDAIVPAPSDASGMRSDTTVDPDLATLLDRLRAQTADGTVGVLVDGGPFRRAVLEALARVPIGARLTYAELAAAAGRPRAVRAAATVMARNRTPLVLPCHRVVPSGGGTGRYAWGSDVKAALLAAESSAAASDAGGGR